MIAPDVRVSFPTSELRVLAAQLNLALAIAVEMMDPAAPTTSRLRAAACAMQIRAVLAVLAERVHVEAPPALPPRLFPSVSLPGFLQLVASRADLPTIIRSCAAELNREGEHGAGDDARNLMALAEHFAAARDIAGLHRKETAQAVTECAEWAYLSPFRVRCAVVLHALAASMVRRP